MAVDATQTCEVCQRPKADHVCLRGLSHPLPLPSRRVGVVVVDWLLGLPMTALSFDQVQVHVNHLSGKVHAATALPPFFIDRGQQTRLPLSLPDLRAAGEPPAAYATRAQALEQEVLALLHAAQQERKAALDRGRVDTTLEVGDRVLLRIKELLNATKVGKSCPRWEGPFTVEAVAVPAGPTRTGPGPAGSPSAPWSSFSTARPSASGPTTQWYADRVAPPPATRGSLWNTSRSSRSGSRNTRRPPLGALRPSGHGGGRGLSLPREPPLEPLLEPLPRPLRPSAARLSWVVGTGGVRRRSRNSTNVASGVRSPHSWTRPRPALPGWLWRSQSVGVVAGRLFSRPASIDLLAIIFV